jgi:hypothetical protein
MRRRLAILATLLLLSGCALSGPPADPFAGMREASGLVLWQHEYAFKPPPPPWELLKLDEQDYSIAFFRGCDDLPPGNYPCEATFAYAEEPFGYSRDLETREKEFFRRFLWAARIDFDKPRLHPARALGEKALLAETIGRERVLKHKVLVRVVFAHRGQRVVAFYYTQWRPEGRDFDRSQLEIFQNFVDSFEFRRPSFFQRL